MASPSSELHDFLLDIRNPNPDEETMAGELIMELRNSLSEFLSILGYEDDELIHDVTVELSENEDDELIHDFVIEPHQRGDQFFSYTFDIFAARSANAPPYLIIETIPEEIDFVGGRDYGSFQPFPVRDFNAYVEAVGAHYIVLFSNSTIYIQTPAEEFVSFDLEELEPKDSARIYELLRAPDIFPQGTPYPAAYHPDQTTLTEFLFDPSAASGSDSFHHIEEELFQLDLKEYSNHLYASEEADTSNEKGDTLEELAVVLVDAIPCLSIRDRNLVTKFGEIDLVLEYQGTGNTTLFDYHTRFCIVECKNWVKPVPAKEIGHFESKCVRTNVDLGIVFAWNGISGEDSDKHATRMVDTTPKENPDIVIINSRDLYRVLDGTSFYRILDQKLYQQRFDIQIY